MNAIFVANKPIFMSSNYFLQMLKRRDKIKRAGYSGTLDPFACGCLIVAYGDYTRLFPYLKKSPKVYRATLQLGLKSSSLDTENIIEVQIIKPFKKEKIQEIFRGLLGEINYIPPKFCAKKIQGKRAYELARNGCEVDLKEQKMEVFSLKLLNYNHPFVTFEVSLSEGGYVRSLGDMIAKQLGSFGALTYLERVCEGKFYYQQEKKLSPTSILEIPHLYFMQEYIVELQKDFENGRILNREKLEKTLDFSQKILENHKMESYLLTKEHRIKNGEYLVEFPKFFSVIRVTDDQIVYLLNRISRC